MAWQGGAVTRLHERGTMAGRMISGAAALAELVRTAGEHDAPGVHRVLPVVPELSGLLPGRGLRRGSTVAVAAGRAAPAGGSTSLLLALMAEASRSGSWCAVVGIPSLGALAAQESGIDLGRLALVPDPGPDWPTVIAALIDGLDVVVTAIPGQVAPTVADRLVARARQRGSVLMPFGQWPGADVTLQVTASRWEGLAPGRGRLRRREVTILARGRGAAARPKEITLWMPGLTHHPPSFPPATGSFPAATGSFPSAPASAPARGLRAIPSASTRPAPGPALRPPVSGRPASSSASSSALGPPLSGCPAPGPEVSARAAVDSAPRPASPSSACAGPVAGSIPALPMAGSILRPVAGSARPADQVDRPVRRLLMLIRSARQAGRSLRSPVRPDFPARPLRTPSSERRGGPSPVPPLSTDAEQPVRATAEGGATPLTPVTDGPDQRPPHPDAGAAPGTVASGDLAVAG